MWKLHSKRVCFVGIDLSKLLATSDQNEESSSLEMKAEDLSRLPVLGDPGEDLDVRRSSLLVSSVVFYFTTRFECSFVIFHSFRV
jgi:hypothetical protein